MGSDENFPGVMRLSNTEGGLIRPRGVASNRRALSVIDKNIIEPRPHHCAVNKRGVPKRGNATTHRKKPAIPVHRPVTRKFAAQLAGKEQQPSIQPTVPLVSTALQSHDCMIIDADDKKNINAHDIPMFKKGTEAMLEGIYGMDADIEMEDISEGGEVIVDIDAFDKNNPLAVTEYVDDLHTYYKKTESLSCVPPNYMSQQFDINERMRAILIDWLIEVHYKFEMMDETLYLTINLIDRFLALQTVVRKKLQLVGVTAMLLACKYEEVSVPVVEDLILITDKAYCRKEVLNMEKLMVNTLEFNLSLPTLYVFMKRFLKAAQSDKRMEQLSFYLINLSLVEYEMLQFLPSLLAAAAVFAAQCSLNGCKKWSKTMEKHSGYTQGELLECAKMMVNFHQKAGTGKLSGVYKKYSTSKYGYAARVEPAVFLINDH